MSSDLRRGGPSQTVTPPQHLRPPVGPWGLGPGPGRSFRHWQAIPIRGGLVQGTGLAPVLPSDDAAQNLRTRDSRDFVWTEINEERPIPKFFGAYSREQGFPLTQGYPMTPAPSIAFAQTGFPIQEPPLPAPVLRCIETSNLSQGIMHSELMRQHQTSLRAILANRPHHPEDRIFFTRGLEQEADQGNLWAQQSCSALRSGLNPAVGLCAAMSLPTLLNESGPPIPFGSIRPQLEHMMRSLDPSLAEPFLGLQRDVVERIKSHPAPTVQVSPTLKTIGGVNTGHLGSGALLLGGGGMMLSSYAHGLDQGASMQEYIDSIQQKLKTVEDYRWCPSWVANAIQTSGDHLIGIAESVLHGLHSGVFDLICGGALLLGTKFVDQCFLGGQLASSVKAVLQKISGSVQQGLSHLTWFKAQEKIDRGSHSLGPHPSAFAKRFGTQGDSEKNRLVNYIEGSSAQTLNNTAQLFHTL